MARKRERRMKKSQRKQDKGMMRSLLRDTQFLQREKRKFKLEYEARRKAKFVQEMRNLTEQARDTNSFQMVGKRLRKKMMKRGIIRGW